MIKNIVWKGLETDSLEFCQIHFNKSIQVHSTVIGYIENLPFKVDYEIELLQDWSVKSFTVKSCILNTEHRFALYNDGKGKWHNGSKEMKGFEGCYDIDISVTPFTNSLPVNRLDFLPNETREINVIYIDILENKITRERQLYTCLGNYVYRFENSTGDFTADIQMDKNKLVKHYPTLFTRVVLKE